MHTKLIIFGITGDLSRRKLLPALEEILQAGEQDISIIGVSRRDVAVSDLLSRDSVVAQHTSIFSMDLSDLNEYIRFSDYLDLQDDEQALIYLSVPPGAAADIVDSLGASGLNTPNIKVLFEKPFGFDLASAEEFVNRTGRYFTEDQIFRIDHYMAKEVAAEVIRLRSNAENHHHHWGNQSVKSVEIIASETLGVEDRAIFYEQTGALRDFIQGHLMQLLSLVLMDLSAPFAIEAVADRRLQALEDLLPADPEKSVRAQYKEYGEEVGNPGSRVETFASVTFESDSPRWQGVPLTLTTGKRLDKKQSAIIVNYLDGTQDIFDEASVASTNRRLPDAYERVLVEAIKGRKYIFTTSPEVIASWENLASVQEAWNMDSEPLLTYPSGSSIIDVLGQQPLHLA